MSRDVKTPGGKTVPADALKAGIRAGREAAADGAMDREYLTAAILAAVDAGASVQINVNRTWRVGDTGHNVGGDRDCDQRFHDSNGDSSWVCTEDDGHETLHVASTWDGRVCAVWEEEE